MRFREKKYLSVTLCSLLFASTLFTPATAVWGEDSAVNSSSVGADSEGSEGTAVADQISDIVESVRELDGSEMTDVTQIQEQIDDVQDAYSELSTDVQQTLSGSMESLDNASVAVDSMQDTLQDKNDTGNLEIDETDKPNSFRYINGQPIDEALEIIDEESDEVAEIEETDSAEDTSVTTEESTEEESTEEVSADSATNTIAEESAEEVSADSATNIIKEDACYSGSTTEVLPSTGSSIYTSHGIDVSQWQGEIDWDQVASSGDVDFVIIRCGYGQDETDQDDTQWERNVSECERLGIPYEVYIYSYATSVSRIDGEVEHVLRLLEGHTPDLPVFIDMEENSQSALGATVISKMASSFCSQIEAAGYDAGVYSSLKWWKNYLTSFSSNNNYYHWIAQWNDTCTYTGRYEVWQYSSKGTVDGISGSADMNYSSLDTDPEPLVKATSHVQKLGWRNSVDGGSIVGTTGKSLRLEALKLSLEDTGCIKGSIQYRAHVQRVGWQNWVRSGKIAGTTGRSLRMEALQIKLTGNLAKKFDVYYCAHVQHYGWLGWAKNGETAGTTGKSLRMEAVRIIILPKGSDAPEAMGNYSQSCL